MKNLLYKLCVLDGDRSNRSISNFRSLNMDVSLQYRLGEKTSGDLGPLFTYNDIDEAQKVFRGWATICPVALLGVEWEPVTDDDIRKYLAGDVWLYRGFWRRYYAGQAKNEFPESVTFVRSVTPVVLIDHAATANGWAWDGRSYERILSLRGLIRR